MFEPFTVILRMALMLQYLLQFYPQNPKIVLELFTGTL